MSSIKFWEKVEEIKKHISGSPFYVTGIIVGQEKKSYFYTVSKQSDDMSSVSLAIAKNQVDDLDIALDSLQHDIESNMYCWIQRKITIFFETRDSDQLESLEYLFLPDWIIGTLRGLLFNDYIQTLEHLELAIETMEVFDSKEEMLKALPNRKNDFIEEQMLIYFREVSVEEKILEETN